MSCLPASSIQALAHIFLVSYVAAAGQYHNLFLPENYALKFDLSGMKGMKRQRNTVYLKASETRSTVGAHLASIFPIFLISATHSSDQAAADTQDGLLPSITASILNTQMLHATTQDNPFLLKCLFGQVIVHKESHAFWMLACWT